MKQKYSLFFWLIAIGYCLLAIGLPKKGFSQATSGIRFNHVSANKFSQDNFVPKDAVEDVSKRSAYNSTWRAKDGKVICCSSSTPINYSDEKGNFQPVNIQLKSDSKGWVAGEQQNPCYFRSDRSTAIAVGEGMEFDFNMNCTVNGMALDQQILKMDNQNIALDLSEGVHKNIRFLNNGIKTNYVFAHPLDGGITVREEIKFPEGCTFMKDEKKGRDWFGGWAGDYILVSSGGDELTRLHTPLFYDANNKKCAGSYRVEQKNGNYYLITSVPSEWLATAAYPVTMDPLVTGALVKGNVVKHHGGDVGSCPYPVYSSDTLLHVVIPGKITIYQLDIDYAYTTKDTTTYQVDLNAGRFYFSTTCGTSPVLYCDSAYPGICYLVPNNDFHSPLTCCYDPNCKPDTFNLIAHLSRVGYPLFGCNNTDYVWYNKEDTFGIFTYKAYVAGYYDSVAALTYTPTSQCSNSCTLQMNALIEFGVPPYTVTHPWAIRDTVVGRYAACSTSGRAIMNLKIPGCPYNCLTDSLTNTITVPSPTVVDACGDTVKYIPTQTVQLKPVPVITSSPDTLNVCTGIPVSLSLNSCIAGTTISWTGSDNVSGTGYTVTDNTVDTGSGADTVIYKIVASFNGCNSDTVKALGIINPYPVVTITGKDTVLLGHSETITATGGGTYQWTPAAGLSCTTCADPVASPTVTTIYYVTVTDKDGCAMEKSFTLNVLDENISIPNVITPNYAGLTGQNSFFYITNLQYYPNSSLTVFDRWGKQVYSSTNYLNNWNGGGQSDGVYYYLLTLTTGVKYKGFFQLIK
jgi:gliding motility-associated-like protein